MRPYFQVRRSTYRGRSGFTVLGCGGGVYRTRIFTETKASAERIRAKLVADPSYSTTIEDFSETTAKAPPFSSPPKP